MLKQFCYRSLQQVSKTQKLYIQHGREFQSIGRMICLTQYDIKTSNSNLSLFLNSNNNNYQLINRRYFADEPKSTETATVERTESEAQDASVSSSNAQEEITIEQAPPKPTYQTKKPIELIAEVPPIEVDGNYAYCNGLYFAADMTLRKKPAHAKEGHPPEWIQLSTRKPYTPQTCKYCGLRFVMKWKPTHPFAKYYKGPDVVIPLGSDKPVKRTYELLPDSSETSNTN